VTSPQSDPRIIADLREAVDRFRNYRSNPVALATADLLDTIADDMDAAGAYERAAFAGTAAQHATVHDQGGHRLDWTAALALARTVLGKEKP
jgi:hypothetical protein